ncbi:MAG: hypothetical protein HY023_02430, partial [Chloroflexi bacterium]|nr:hypothetical protein [Chloroflexota bacterium]
SYLTLFPGAPHLYEPQNWLRLTTGTLCGLAIGALVLPSFNGTLWRSFDERRVLANFRELGVLLVVAGIMSGLVLTENPIVLLPLALLSSAGVLVLLTMIQVTLWLALFRRANLVETWRGAFTPVVFGLTMAVAQVAAIDALRYAFTGTWSGFALLG